MEHVNLTTKQIASGVAKVFADVRSANGEWQQFNATISKTGDLVNTSFKDTQKGSKKLENQLSQQQKAATNLSVKEMSRETLSVRDALGLVDEKKWSVTVNQSGFDTIKNLLNDITNSAAKSEQTFRKSTEAITKFNGIAEKGKVTLSDKTDGSKKPSQTQTSAQIKAGYSSDISKTEQELKNLAIYSQEAKEKIAGLKSQVQTLGNDSSITEFGKKLKSSLADIKADNVKSSKSSFDGVLDKLTQSSDTKITAYGNEIKKLSQYIKIKYSIDAVKNSAGEMTYAIRESASATSSASNNLSAYAGRWKGLLSSGVQYFTQFMSIYYVVGMMRQGFTGLQGYNDALTNISYTMDLSSES